MTTIAQIEAKLKKNYPSYTKLQLESLQNYSFKWSKPINILLRTGEAALDKFMNADKSDRQKIKNLRGFGAFKNDNPVQSTTAEIAIKNVKDRVEQIDSAFLLAAPRTKKEMILWRGKKGDYYDDSHSIHTGITGERNIEKGYVSSTEDIDIAMNFVDKDTKKSKKNPKNCCLYRVHVMDGIPYIDMSHGLGQYEESELLLPRDLRVTRIANDAESDAISDKYKIKVIDIRIDKIRADQFDKPRSGATLEPSSGATLEPSSKAMGGKRIKKHTTKTKKRLMKKKRKTIRRTFKQR